MTNREYREKINTIDSYSSHDYLGKKEMSELRENNKIKEQLDGYTYLSGSNFRAMVRKDYYGKVLISYATDVCMIDNDGNFVKLWDGYSSTTLKHINKFRRINGFAEINKRKWIELDVG